MKSPLRLALALGGAVLISIVAFTACYASKNGIGFSFGSGSWPERAERTDVSELHVASGQLLRAETPYGVIRVRGTAAAVGSMHATIHTFGKTQEDARARLDRTRVVIDESSTGATLRLEFTADSSAEGGSPSPTVDFELEVPAGVALALESSSGDVSAEGGPFGAVRIASSYGNVALDHATGEVTATSKSGSVGVSHVSGVALEARSGYGEVTIADVESTKVAAKSSSGDVSAERVKSAKLTLESGYGTVTLRNITVEGDVEASSKSGDVSGETVSAARLSLSSNFGAIRVKHADAFLTLETSSGDIAVEDVKGSLSAKTGYGSVEAEGVFSGLTAESKSGNVSIRARDGSQAALANTIVPKWAISSKYGNVELEAPKDMRCDLSAKTSYGDIDLGYAIELAPGTLSKKGHDIQGKINGGGVDLRIETASGNVSIRPGKP